jgi:hypothetical protein
MYAIKLTTDVYHLVQRGGQHTLCGLRVTPITSGRNAGRLQMVNAVSEEKKICKHCERIREQDAMAGDTKANPVHHEESCKYC